MKLASADLSDLAQLSVTAARRAADYIRSEVGEHRDVHRKEGGSSHASQVVTEVDLESQRLILDVQRDSISTYDLGLLTEESKDDGSRQACDYFWCIDPLDGTLPFIENVAGFSVSIALVSRAGVPVIGVIADPRTDTTYHAIRDGGAFRNGATLALGPVGGGSLTFVMDRSFAKLPDYDAILAKVHGIAAAHQLAGVEVIDQGGAAMNACWVIENAPAVYFKFPKLEDGGGSLWDYAASACLFEELGASASDICGRPLALNRPGSTFMNEGGVVYASSSALRQAICGVYRP